MEWQPIETAPKDGSKILVWADGYEWPEIVCFEKYDDETAIEAGEPGYWRYAEELIANVADVEPDMLTHWMPLPAAPELA